MMENFPLIPIAIGTQIEYAQINAERNVKFSLICIDQRWAGSAQICGKLCYSTFSIIFPVFLFFNINFFAPKCVISSLIR